MVDGIGNVNEHQPALQQSQTVKQPATTDANQAQDPNSGNRNRELLDEAVQQHIIDEAAKRDERGQNLNISV
ncbi:MAG: hypothetical protein GKS03_04415 [Alphaproteobacteria bacterium]|nr:hypothetical protein [Alphaproteobacteria bacterium]